MYKNFNIDMIINNHKKKINNKKKIYKQILNKCIKHIIFESNKCNDNCQYTINKYYYGCPLFDTLECSKYIEKKLVKANFKIKRNENNLLISWKHLL